MHGRMTISILVVCGALAAGSPSAALAADVPLPVDTDTATEQVAHLQRSVPQVAVAPVAEEVAREALPSAVAPPVERMAEHVHGAASPSPVTAEHAPRVTGLAVPHAEPRRAVQPLRH